MKLLTLIGGRISRAFAGLKQHRPRKGEPGVGWMSNGRTAPYHLRCITTTGYMAVRLAWGRTRVFVARAESPQLIIVSADSLTFWSCVSGGDRSMHGDILMLSCSNSNLSLLDLSQLAGLEELDCSNNPLKKLGVNPSPRLRIALVDGTPLSTKARQ